MVLDGLAATTRAALATRIRNKRKMAFALRERDLLHPLLTMVLINLRERYNDLDISRQVQYTERFGLYIYKDS